ncbi:hypothetical protein PJKIFABJ_00014 [Pseudomonas phage PE09]|uniref:DUF7448 domain-containing protein n=2 Tax=Otagovirus TaxID=2560197 RepID=A0A7S7YCG9_9CAUD|nr:hypothetical protein QGX22_gp014 [Pseudomonas phage PE09]YP_010768319.1 hypothetical protein QGX23_gp011 [Pseudomonas phage PN09]QHZ59969.1 hypothetical protein PJKIFABJ_00014 [Pseudomonas phage PE09]QPB10432.1 hypothetical protein PN09_011 [Pseudomonas phage PN09]
MKIASIEEVTFGKENSSWYAYEGYEITLDNGQKIKMGIDNGQSCCENWGYIISEDNLAQFVGAEYYGIEAVGQALEHVEIKDVYEGGIMFININTSEGVLQFVAYNEHNGYYSHQAVVIENGTVLYSESL